MISFYTVVSAALIKAEFGLALLNACKEVAIDVLVARAGWRVIRILCHARSSRHQKNVLVIDKASRLGGHVNTVKVPGLDQPIDFGVLSYPT